MIGNGTGNYTYIKTNRCFHVGMEKFKNFALFFIIIVVVLHGGKIIISNLFI